jgi:hypothetical protein
MTTAEATELSDVLNRVKTWPATQRITLARRILETLEAAPRATRGLSARSVQELIGIGAGDSPPPDDETVRRWIDEHRMEKYGS